MAFVLFVGEITSLTDAVEIGSLTIIVVTITHLPVPMSPKMNKIYDIYENIFESFVSTNSSLCYSLKSTQLILFE